MSIPGSVYIINPQSGKALDVEGAGTGNSTKVQLYEQNRTVAQKWVIASDGSIINPNSGKALDVSGGGTANGTQIQIYERNGTGAQKWVLNPDGSIINPQSGKALDVSGGGTTNGTKIQIYALCGYIDTHIDDIHFQPLLVTLTGHTPHSSQCEMYT